MMKIRKSEDRGHAQHGWLDSHHTFSFADYYDPKHVGFRSLRVINEDRVAPGRGFGTHGHRDMEILSYVLKGSLAHNDNMGHQELLGPNEIQRMSAGTGIMHSEFNPSPNEPVHFLQIWIQPATSGGESSYEQIAFAAEEKRGKWRLLAGPQGGSGVAQINQDARVLVSELGNNDSLEYPLKANRHAWVHVVKGEVKVNGANLSAGDAAALSNEEALNVAGSGDGPNEVLLFDLA
jgi:redox-sensitive bicupin YhaK (pirin superfamily)